MENISDSLDSALERFEKLDQQPGLPLPMKYRMLKFQLDFRFLKLFCRFIMINDAAGTGQGANLDSIKISLEVLLKKRRTAEERAKLASDVPPMLESLKTKIKEICEDLWDCSMKATSGTSNEIKEFMDLVLWNLRDFLEWKKGVLSAHLEHKIRTLLEKLCFIENLFDFSAKRCSDQQKLEGYCSFIQDVMNSAACLSVMYWTDTDTHRNDDNQTARLDSMLADLLRKIYSPMAIKMHFGLLLTSRSLVSEKSKITNVIMCLCDLLLAGLVARLKDRFEAFREGLIFLTTFLMNPPEKPEREAGDELLIRIDDIINDVASSISAIYMVDFEVYITDEGENFLNGAQVKIDKLMAEVREIYVQIPKFPRSTFPVNHEIRFIDRLLGNLKEIMKSKGSSIPLATDKILSIQQELQSIRAFLKDAIRLKNDQLDEVEDLWKRIIIAAYHVEHVVNSCFITDTPIWYDMLSLSTVIEEIKVIKIQVQKIRKADDDEYHSGPLLSKQVNAPQPQIMKGNFVGLKDEMQTIVNRLTRGTKQLDIISIVGMAGQGKTTLARKVYNDPSVKHHFRKCAWCYVSQVYQTKQLLLDILSSVADADSQDSYSNACEDELADLLRRSLKGKRFLIVLDDIWDIGAWDGIKMSLPDDGMCSRIVFTSRLHDLASKAKPNCNPHPIRPLNDEESWALLQETLFHNGNCPSELSEFGKKIASKCEGLPLAVVLVAGILARTEKNLNSWKEIIGSMGSHIATEGCRNLLELSYKHLPACLRPCFLYFGAFSKEKIIRVSKLIQLWTAEGFVPRNGAKSLDEMAREYLMDLIDRSLVTVAARSSTGEVKDCRLHDLLHDFCLTKAGEQRLLHKFHARDISDDSPKLHDQHRLCIDVSEFEQLVHSGFTSRYVHSVLVSGVYEESAPSLRLISSFYVGFKFLHVLDMESIYSHLSFPEEIALMVHLRYLAVWFAAADLTSSIANLWNLETLIVKVSGFFSALPDAILSMNTLRHIAIPGMILKDYKIEKRLMPLHNVGYFSAAILTSEEDAEMLSRILPQLRKLKILPQMLWSFDDDPMPFPALSRLTLLESLSICVNDIRWHMLEFASFDFPSTLKKLTLRKFCLRKRAMSTIGKLPNLEVLKLGMLLFLDQTWDLEDGEFLNLKYLELSMVNLRHWNDCNEPFPCLERLVLKFCGNLEEIPPNFADIPTLIRMDVDRCPKASSSAKQIVENQRDVLQNAGLEFYVTE